MDDEDLREREETRQISTADGFAGFGAQGDQAPHHALDDIFKPAQDTMGEKLLNKMGWKKGQGIGPRVRRRVDPNDETSETKDFPPEDSPMLDFSQKQDTKGLGFGNDHVSLTKSTSGQRSKSQTADEASDDDERPALNFARSSSKKKVIKSTGIGVGSLNDTGSDDEDPYEMGPKMSYNRVLGGEKKPKKSKSSTSSANPLLRSKPIFVSKKLPTVLTTLRKCHDGKLPLTGFVLADSTELDTFGAMSLSDEKYKPPEVPEDWQPKPIAEKPDTVNKNTSASSNQHAPTVQHQTAQSRANALKETPLPSKSVFDYLSPAARERLVTASGKSNLPPALNEAPPTPNTTTSSTTTATTSTNPHLLYPPVDLTTATTALTRLRKDKSTEKPYADDLPKQGRYKDFLRFSVDTSPINHRIPPLRAPNHKSDEEHLAELQEFANTANLFRPATGFLGSRFTSAASAAAVTAGSGVLSDQPDEDNQNDDEELLRRPPEKPKDPAEEAARMGMFGPATRSTTGFFPTKLVCKRFGVDMPSGLD